MRGWRHRRPRRRRDRRSLRRVGTWIGIAILGALLLAWALGTNGRDQPAPTGSDGAPFAYDATEPLNADESEATGTTAPGYSLRDVRFTSFDGSRVRAIFAAPRDERRPYRCVVSQGGLAGSLQSFRVLESLARSDYAVFTVEPRSSATPDAALRAAQSPMSLRPMLRRTVIDLRRGLDYLEQSGRCRPGIGYLGGSFGGMLGAMVAAVDRRIAAAALIGAGGNWRHLVEGEPQVFLNEADQGPRLRRAVRLLRVVDPARWIGDISPRPVLLMNGRSDTTMPPAAARALRAAARAPKEVIRPPTDHDPFDDPIAGRLHRQVADFFRRWLPRG